MATIDVTRPCMEQLSRFRTADAMRRLFTAPRRNAATALMLAAMAAPAFGQGQAAAPGANEIRIGNTVPYTGPASAYGVIGKVMAAYFDKVNAEGGIKGRKINFISYDDAYNPTKTMEATRKLVEEDNVLFILASLGTNTEPGGPPLSEREEDPAAVRRLGRDDVGSAARVSLDHGLPAQLPDRSPHLFAIYPGEPSAQQDRGALSGRWFRQGLPQGPEGRPRWQGSDRGRGGVQGDGHLHRRSDRQAQGLGRRHLHAIHHAEIRHHGDQAKCRNRLEAGAFPRLGV